MAMAGQWFAHRPDVEEDMVELERYGYSQWPWKVEPRLER
jgi:hypothetical protein